MKKLSIFTFATVVAASVGMMTACTKDNNKTETTRTETTRTQDADQGNKTEETYQAPGTVAKTEQEKGHEKMEVRKQVTKTETEKESLPTVEEKHIRADANRMSAEEFQKLGLSKEAADSIVQYRKDHGNFHSVDELRNVPGVNTAWLERMRGQLAVSSG